MENREYSTAPEERIPERIPEMDKNLRAYLRKEITNKSSANPEEIIAKIEELSRESLPNPRTALMSYMTPIFQENTSLFVNRLFGYKKRMCRDSPHCRRVGCYFRHENTDENMMEVEERRTYAPDRHANSGKQLLEKQKRILGILSSRRDLPPDVLSLIDQLKKLTSRIKPAQMAQEMASSTLSTRFVISDRKEWMTREHLATYPGVLNVTEEGVVECASRQDAERVVKMLSKIDYTAKPTWV
ncbi:hypothetical protein NECID01_0141 [Nematocida sp. AWRm77]|nr:hypothetical protein NECID01_0141 [Nematocida sp. AWRm77]